MNVYLTGQGILNVIEPTMNSLIQQVFKSEFAIEIVIITSAQKVSLKHDVTGIWV